MNKPLTVSLEGIGQFVLHPDILFSLQSSPHTLHSSCPPNNTSSWAGKHWGSRMPQSCTHLEATGFWHLTQAPVLFTPVHTARFAELLLAKCAGQLSYDCCCLAQIPSSTAENMKSHGPACSTTARWLGSCCAAWTWKSNSFPSSSAVSTQHWIRDKFNSFWFHILSFIQSEMGPSYRLIVNPLFPLPMLVLPWGGDYLLFITN